MGTTPVYGLRFPEGADTPDVPRDIENLALDVEAVVAAIPPPVSLDAVGNLLTANQASVETDTTGWVAYGGLIARSTVKAAHGSGSLLVTANNTGAGYGGLTTQGTGGIPVAGGNTYTAQGVLSAASGTRLWRVDIFWYTAAGTYISSASNPVWVTPDATWRISQVTAVAPANAAYAAVAALTAASGLTTDAAYLDRVGFWAGAGGEWAMPGTPITNLGTKVEHPNTDDVATYVWDAGKGRWQLEYYDSGWRDISSLLVNGWTMVNACRLRRLGNLVTITSTVNGSAATATGLLTLPIGFCPGGANLQLPVPIGAAMTAGVVAEYGTNGIITMWAGNGKPGTQSIHAVFSTDDAIPTTLPGTLISPAPN